MWWGYLCVRVLLTGSNQATLAKHTYTQHCGMILIHPLLPNPKFAPKRSPQRPLETSLSEKHWEPERPERGRDSFLPGAHNKLIPGQVKGELGVVSHTGVGESGDPRTEFWDGDRERSCKSCHSVWDTSDTSTDEGWNDQLMISWSTEHFPVWYHCTLTRICKLNKANWRSQLILNIWYFLQNKLASLQPMRKPLKTFSLCNVQSVCDLYIVLVVTFASFILWGSMNMLTTLPLTCIWSLPALTT